MSFERKNLAYVVRKTLINMENLFIYYLLYQDVALYMLEVENDAKRLPLCS